MILLLYKECKLMRLKFLFTFACCCLYWYNISRIFKTTAMLSLFLKGWYFPKVWSKYTGSFSPKKLKKLPRENWKDRYNSDLRIPVIKTIYHWITRTQVKESELNLHQYHRWHAHLKSISCESLLDWFEVYSLGVWQIDNQHSSAI